MVGSRIAQIAGASSGRAARISMASSAFVRRGFPGAGRIACVRPIQHIRSGDTRSNSGPLRPGPGDVGPLIEVAVTSLHDDLTTTRDLYARASIPVYWVLDVLGRRILVHAEPRVVDGTGEYARVEIYLPGQSLPL